MPSRGLVRDSADGHKFVGILPNAEFFAVLDQILPVRIVMRGMEAVTVVLVLQIGDGAVWKNRLTVDSLGAGQIQRDGVGGCKHPDVRDDGHVVFRVAVAVRRDVADDIDAVAGTTVQHGLGVFRNLAVEEPDTGLESRMDGVLGTDRDAAAAADAVVLIDPAFFVFDLRAVVRADLRAGAAADAQVCFDIRLAVGVHGHLARTRAAAHADVLERAAEARLFMALEVCQ